MSNRGRTGAAERRDIGASSRVAPLGGVHTITGILPTGRVAWLTMAPPLVSAAGIDRLAHAAIDGARRRRAGALAGRRAIRRRAAQVKYHATVLSAARLTRARRLRHRLLVSHLLLDRRLTAATRAYHARVRRQMAIERTAVRRLARRDLWDKIVIASSMPLFAAYGQKGRPHAVNNVTLLLSLLMWIVGDELVNAIFGGKSKSPYPLRDADAWSYIAPFGNVMTGWWLFSGRQHQRFITGTASRFALEAGTTPGTAVLTRGLSLSPFIAPQHYPDFVQFEGVRAVAAIRSIAWSAEAVALNARVTGISVRVTDIPTFVEHETIDEIPGRLIVRVSVAHDVPAMGGGAVSGPLVDSLDVAWLVDTQDPKAPQT